MSDGCQTDQDLWRPAFKAALLMLANACAKMKDQGRSVPILVGRAVVEFQTSGEVVSVDFDLVLGADETAFAEAPVAEAICPRRPKKIKEGGILPSRPDDRRRDRQIVASLYFDGRADRTRLRLVGDLPVAAI